jgi:Zinc-finger
MAAPSDMKARQRAIRLRINDLMDMHCKGCASNVSHHTSRDATDHQEVCLTACAIGKQIRQLGQLLEAKGGERVMGNAPGAIDELTREKYLEHKAAGLTDSEIRKKYGFKHPNDLTNWKKQNGVEGVRLGPSPEQRPNISDKPIQKEQSEEMVLKLATEQTENGVEERIRYLEKALKAANQARLELEAKLEQAQREGSALSALLDKLKFLEMRTEDWETAMKIVQEIEAADLDFELYKRFGRYVVSHSKLAGGQQGEVK